MASKSKNKPPTSIIPGDDARRWREGVSAQRDAEIARRIASSIMSLRFVMPMTRMLLSESTPSILLSNWLTILSETPVPSRTLPRLLQIASCVEMKLRAPHAIDATSSP